MKKLLYIALALFLSAPVLTSCRDQKNVEVETLDSDANDSTDDESYDTNPTENDPD